MSMVVRCRWLHTTGTKCEQNKEVKFIRSDYCIARYIAKENVNEDCRELEDVKRLFCIHPILSLHGQYSVPTLGQQGSVKKTANIAAASGEGQVGQKK